MVATKFVFPSSLIGGELGGHHVFVLSSLTRIATNDHQVFFLLIQ